MSSGIQGHQLQPQKKTPACDPCREKRVLCHPQPNGEPCPRCVVKGFTCITTPRTRRKAARQTSVQVEDTEEPAGSASTSVPHISNRSIESALSAGEVSASLVTQLIQEFRILPQACHPAILGTRVFQELDAVSYKVHFLSPARRALVYAVMTCSALLSSHPLILGSSPARAAELCLEFGQDLRQFGRDRQPAWGALRSIALDLAFSSSVLYEPTWDNIFSCYLLDASEYHVPGREASNVPKTFANAHAHHARAIASREDWNPTTYFGMWNGPLMSDALLAVKTSGAISFTHQDSLLLRGSAEEDTLDAILERLLTTASDMSHTTLLVETSRTVLCVTRLCAKVTDNLTGVPARRAPFNHQGFLLVMKELDTLRSIATLLVNSVASLPRPFPSAYPESLLQLAVTAVGIPWAALVYATYLELKRRHNQFLEMALSGSESALQAAVYEATQCAVVAAIHAAERLASYPWIGYMAAYDWMRPGPFVDILLAEHEMTLAMDLEREANQALGSLLDILKLRGWCDADDGGLVERIEERLSTNPFGMRSDSRSVIPMPAPAIMAAAAAIFPAV